MLLTELFQNIVPELGFYIGKLDAGTRLLLDARLFQDFPARSRCNLA